MKKIVIPPPAPPPPHLQTFICTGFFRCFDHWYIQAVAVVLCAMCIALQWLVVYHTVLCCMYHIQYTVCCEVAWYIYHRTVTGCLPRCACAVCITVRTQWLFVWHIVYLTALFVMCCTYYDAYILLLILLASISLYLPIKMCINLQLMVIELMKQATLNFLV